MKDLNTFYHELKAAGALTGAFATAVKNGSLGDFLKANDVDATAEEFMALTQGELGDNQLDAVAGGANLEEALMSIFTFGFGCAIVAIESAVGGGVGNGENGALLCNDYSYPEY